MSEPARTRLGEMGTGRASQQPPTPGLAGTAIPHVPQAEVTPPRIEDGPALGATEDKVERSEAVVAPEVTDKGRDERGRDQPDGAEFGRGTMPDNAAVDEIAETQSEPDAPRYGRSPWQGLGGARPHADEAHGEEREQGERAGDTAGERRLTPSGTLPAEEVVGQGSHDTFGARGDGGGGMLNTEVPAGMAGVGPLGGTPARGDTADAAAHRRKHGMPGPSAAGARDIHLGIGHNSPTGESTPGMHARADTPGHGEEEATGAEAERTAQRTPPGSQSKLPTSSGAGGTQPHLDPQLDQAPEAERKDGRPGVSARTVRE
jgi:hypothetical protein